MTWNWNPLFPNQMANGGILQRNSLWNSIKLHNISSVSENSLDYFPNVSLFRTKHTWIIVTLITVNRSKTTEWKSVRPKSHSKTLKYIMKTYILVSVYFYAVLFVSHFFDHYLFCFVSFYCRATLKLCTFFTNTVTNFCALPPQLQLIVFAMAALKLCVLCAVFFSFFYYCSLLFLAANFSLFR